MYKLSKGRSTVYDCRDDDDMLPWSRDGALRALQSRDPACLVSENMLERFADVMTEPETPRLFFAHSCPECGGGLCKKEEQKAKVSTTEYESYIK